MTIWRTALQVLTVAATAGAGYLIYRNISKYSLDELTASIAEIGFTHLAAALGFAACSYLCLSLFDLTALHYVGKRLPYPKVLLTSFVSLSIGHNVGVAALSSGAIRYRYYSRWGLSAAEVAKLIVFCGVTVGLGIVGLAGAAILLAPADAMMIKGLEIPASRGLGALCLGIVLLYPLASLFMPPTVRIRRWQLGVPDPRLALAQVVIGMTNFALVAGCLHQLLLATADVGYLQAARAYAIANLAAIISHVPGGLGVLEAAIYYTLPEAFSIGAVIAFRIVYFFLPLALGLPLLAASEIHRRHAATRAVQG